MSGLNEASLAVLALDSYQRGYYAGMPDENGGIGGLEDAVGTAVGGGTLIATASVLGEPTIQTADFYATAYLIGGEVVISYRGSDHLLWASDENGNVVSSGEDGARVAALAAGAVPDQAMLALDFFNHVRSLYPSANITLTGHSLGGALAGYVAHLKNAPAVIFDNTGYIDSVTHSVMSLTGQGMPYDASLAAKVFVDTENPWSQFGTAPISQVAMSNDVAGIFRIGNNVDNVAMGTPLAPILAHSMDLLVFALRARDEHGHAGEWTNVANAVFTELSNDGFAASLGFSGVNGNPASGVMKGMIAHTALGGEFGNSALDVLVDDMQTLGRAVGEALYPFMEMAISPIVRFAGLLAKNAVNGQSSGILDYSGGVLTIDYSDETWAIVNGGSLPGTGPDYTGLLADGLLDEDELLGLTSAGGSADKVLYGVHSASAIFQYTMSGVSGDNLSYYSRLGDETITGSSGNDNVSLFFGDDTYVYTGGVDVIDGGIGNDTLEISIGWQDLMIEQVGDAIVMARRETTAAPSIIVARNVEKFILNGNEFSASELFNVAPSDIKFEPAAGDEGLARGTYTAGAIIADLQAIDANEFDVFTWEMVGPGADLYTIDANGMVRTKASVTYDYAAWRQQVGSTTFEQWQAGDLGTGFEALLGTQYGFTVKVTDINGASKDKDIYLFLEDGEDTTFGTPLNDTLAGGPGRTVIAGLGGADRITDTNWLVLDYSASDAGVGLSRASTTDTVFEGFWGHAQGDLISLGSANNRYDIIGSAHGDNIRYAYEVLAGGGNDVITGSKIVYAGDGYDIVNVTSYTDYIDFGAGGGELKLAQYTNGYFVDMGAGVYQRMSGGTVVHSLAVVGDFDKLTGSNYVDYIHGTADHDWIIGGGNLDFIYGYDGDDEITGAGSIWGGAGNDDIVLSMGSAWGQEGDDTLSTSHTGAQLFGGADNDTLTSTTYGVVLVGGLGADTFIGSNAANSLNMVSYQDAAGGVGISHNGSTGFGWLGEADGDILQGNFSFIGSSHGDDFNVVLRPGYGAVLRAGGGDDVIYASKGSYTEIHGDGVDGSTGSDNDTIVTTGSKGKVFGGRGNDTIVGAGELHGGTGEDTITVNAEGTSNIFFGMDSDMDTFVFTGVGYVGIGDFTSEDRIRITTEHTFSEIMEDAVQVGSHIQLWFDDVAKIHIANYDLGSLNAEHFLFA